MKTAKIVGLYNAYLEEKAKEVVKMPQCLIYY